MVVLLLEVVLEAYSRVNRSDKPKLNSKAIKTLTTDNLTAGYAAQLYAQL